MLLNRTQWCRVSHWKRPIKCAQSSEGHKSKEPPIKRHKTDSEIGAEKERDTLWMEKYDATGLVVHYADASHVPEHLQKCACLCLGSRVAMNTCDWVIGNPFPDFSQRFRLFSEYSTPPGCPLDKEGWYSMTQSSSRTRLQSGVGVILSLMRFVVSEGMRSLLRRRVSLVRAHTRHRLFIGFDLHNPRPSTKKNSHRP